MEAKKALDVFGKSFAKVYGDKRQCQPLNANEAILKSNEEFLEPATSIIKLLGGVCKTAVVSGRDVSNVCKWRWSRVRGGTGGLIPTKVFPSLALEARRLGKEMKFANLIMEGAGDEN